MAAINSLNIFPQNEGITSQIGNQDVSSIFEILNNTKTSIGRRVIRRWLKQPIRDEKEINRRLDIVEYFNSNNETRFDIQNDHLRQFPDIEKLHVKFYKVKNGIPNRANLVDCVKVYNIITSLESMTDYLNKLGLPNDHPIEKNYTKVVASIITDFEDLKTMIEESIDINEVAKGDYIINPEYSDVLQELYSKIKEKHKEMEEYRKKLVEQFDIEKPINLIESLQHGFLLEVNKKEGDQAFRKCKEPFTVVTTKKGYISFTSKHLKGLVEQFQEMQQEYKIEQDTLVMKVLDIVATYFPVIERASIVISELDALVSFAIYSSSSNSTFCRPEINSRIQKIILVDSRHPLLERINPEECISNDCNMVRGSSNLQLITGPNMGGKSTYIRQIGINCLLAHCGCFLPCSKAEIPIMDAII
jgi:DNA mismatch repair protein MSH2